MKYLKFIKAYLPIFKTPTIPKKIPNTVPEIVPSTYHILKEKALNRPINESWVSWACEMIEAGFESMNLYELAGIIRPYDQLELIRLTDEIFKEFNIDNSNPEQAIRNYIYYIIKNNIINTNEHLNTLHNIQDLYSSPYHPRELNFSHELYHTIDNFHTLYLAKCDFINDPETEHGWYDWDIHNIDKAIKQEFEKYISEHEKSNNL